MKTHEDDRISQHFSFKPTAIPKAFHIPKRIPSAINSKVIFSPVVHAEYQGRLWLGESV